MARARTLKPSFFTNDQLAELPAFTRLMFAGLWTIADREGRLEDRPRKIKAELFPYDDLNTDEMLDALASNGFIIRYQVGNDRFIQVINFGKHQRPHNNETTSNIPEYRAILPRVEGLPTKVESASALIPYTVTLNPEPYTVTLVPFTGESPEEPKGEERPKTPRRSPETFVPDPFPLEEKHYKYAAEKGFSRQAAEMETERFLLWHGAKQTKYSDWYKAWQGWLLRAVKDTGKLTPFQKPEAAPKQNDTTDVENFHKHRRLRDRLFNTWEYEDYVLKPGGEERYQADLAKYTALVEGNRSSAA